MAKKTTKKVDVKKVAKMEMSKNIKEMLGTLGVEVYDGEDFGFTAGTVVARMGKCDIQIKLITPKAGVDRYDLLEEEEEEEIVEETPTEEVKEENTEEVKQEEKAEQIEEKQEESAEIVEESTENTESQEEIA